MITEVIRYSIPPAEVGAFLQAYTAAVQVLQQSPHCLGYKLLHGEEEPDHWVLLIRWTSTEGHLQGFRTSQEFAEFFRLVRPFYSNIQEMKHYAGTALSWAK
jgi:quinol monooxygenase YgiN